MYNDKTYPYSLYQQIIEDIKKLDPEFPILQFKINHHYLYPQWEDFATIRPKEDSLYHVAKYLLNGHVDWPNAEFRVIGQTVDENHIGTPKILFRSDYVKE